LAADLPPALQPHPGRRSGAAGTAGHPTVTPRGSAPAHPGHPVPYRAPPVPARPRLPACRSARGGAGRLISMSRLSVDAISIPRVQCGQRHGGPAGHCPPEPLWPVGLRRAGVSVAAASRGGAQWGGGCRSEGRHVLWSDSRCWVLVRVKDTIYSGFSSDRINLSPFTKDFRGEEQARVSRNFLRLHFGGAAL